MTVKPKPEPKVVRAAAKKVARGTGTAFERHAAPRILDDQRNAPQPDKPLKKR
jgi:hypothetical protein